MPLQKHKYMEEITRGAVDHITSSLYALGMLPLAVILYIGLVSMGHNKNGI